MDRFISMAVFVAAAEQGSLSAVSRQFGMSPSMAGKHVAALEIELGVRLLQRTTRKLSLTEPGSAYYGRCKRILEDIEDANREAGDSQRVVRGVLRVAAPATFGAMHLGGVLAHFLASHPEATAEVRLSDRYVDLLADSVDVAIRIGRLPDSDLVAKRLAPCRMAVCASPRFLERHGPIQSMQELRRAPRLAFSDAVSVGDWTLVDRNGEMHSVDGPVLMAASNMQVLLSAALAGSGIVFGPTFVLGERLAAGDLVELLPNYRAADLAIHAVYPSARNISLKSRTFIDFLAKSFGGHPSWDKYLTTAA